MTHDFPPETIPDEVDSYSAQDVPLIDNGDPTVEIIGGEVEDKGIDEKAIDMLRGAFHALRGQGTPNFLNPLMLEDRLTIGQIAGRIHCDPRDLKYGINILVERGVIELDTSEPHLPRYTLLPAVMLDMLERPKLD